jgi:outer membrane biosynthesis protein TonB
MHTLRMKYQSFDKEKRIYLWTFLLSLLIHLFLILFMMKDAFIIDLSPEEKNLPEEVTVVFPENKPKTIVENINENNLIPEQSDLLSDFNSQGRNKQLLERMSNQPFSNGNIPLPNLTLPNLQKHFQDQFQTKKFTKDALIGKQAADNDSRRDAYQESRPSAQANQSTTNNIYDQKQFSADQLGESLTLSTYAWEWAPYINAMKSKLYQVWHTPPAYHMLGLIYGQTDIEFSISREGELISYKVLNHQGHESLEVSSVNAITAIFPFKPLPDNFPEESLTITARLIYPNLKRSY